MANALMIIRPYRWEGLWVFDDDRKDLDREPFVAGADSLIDQMIELKSLKEAENGFLLLFSGSAFPGHDDCLVWQRAEEDGNVYLSRIFGAEAWLCPALLKYFDDVPPHIYVQFRPVQPD